MNEVGGFISIVLLCTISRLTSSGSAGLAKAKHNWLKSFVESKGASVNKGSADLVIPLSSKLGIIHLRLWQIFTIFDPYPPPSAFQQNAYEGDF